ADRMLDMGFSDDVLAIARALPAERQTVCFTATISQSVHDLSRQLQRDPQRISVSAPPEQKVAIDQSVVFVDDIAHKRRLLGHWLTDAATVQAIVFTATKRDAESLAELLDADGHSTVALHGDLPQRARTRMLNQLRRGEARVLVATDVAARGLDVPTVTHVFNFDLPRMAEDYVHRIGRTGRAGASGVAVSFVGRQDLMVLRRIERFLGNPVRVNAVVGLEARFNPSERSSRPRPDGKPGSSRFGKPGGAPFKRNGSPDGAKRFGGEAGRSFAGPRPEGNRGERSFGGPRPDGNRGGERSSWRRDGAGNGAETPWRHGEADGNRGERRRPEADGNRARPGETHARRDGGWEKRGASPAGVKRRDRDDY
ncbi:MAG: DEAD/DEAH box helicase, partial [Rhodocyclaceae bacterium]|nr:DEAD/DEAH box helicase [Rhodocyclaceae bacterium]